MYLNFVNPTLKASGFYFSFTHRSAAPVEASCVWYALPSRHLKYWDTLAFCLKVLRFVLIGGIGYPHKPLDRALNAAYMHVVYHVPT